MSRIFLVILASVITMFTAVAAIAGPFPTEVQGTDGIPTALEIGGHPEQYEAVNALLNTSYTSNSAIDGLFVEPEPLWQNLSGTIAVIGLSAGNTNTLGIYTDTAGGNKTAVTDGLSGFGFLGAGTDTSPYPGYTMNIPANQTFGWYLQSNSTFFYSDATLNADGFDHMMVFDMRALAGKTIFMELAGVTTPYTFNNPYLLCWEDVDMNLADKDYNDMIYLVDRVSPVPEPAAMLLLGLSLMGLAGIKRKIAK